MGAEDKEGSLCKESLGLGYTSKEVSAKPKSWNQKPLVPDSMGSALASLLSAALGHWWGWGGGAVGSAGKATVNSEDSRWDH